MEGDRKDIEMEERLEYKLLQRDEDKMGASSISKLTK